VKPPPFTYHRAHTRDEVDSILAGMGEDAKILAGGQSLIPILNMRLATPAHLVDINHLQDEPAEPSGDDGNVSFGPLVRHSAAERSVLVKDRLPLLWEAMPYVAHPAIRSRGTVVGSIAHADPAAELPAVLALLEGTVIGRSSSGTRVVAAGDFFAGPLENSLRPDEWVEAVLWPRRADGWGYAFEEFARRRGDYALCGVAASARRSGNGSADVAVAYLGMGDAPARLSARCDEVDVEDAVAQLVSDNLEPPGDLHARPDYRAHLARRLGARAVRRSLDVAHEDS
jgi:aerobic carbon-monoxide dehydrogenase medium subunit